MLLCVVFTTSARAADVRFNISATETYIGRPVALSIEIENATEHDQPTIPAIEGVLISAPSKSERSLSLNVNGKQTEYKTIILTYLLVPQQPGTFTIPSFSITADGQTFTSQPFDVTVVMSEAGDLLFVDVLAEKESIYLGQPLRLMLQIWVKQFQDRQLGVRPDQKFMLERIDPNGSMWGDFAGVLSHQTGPTTPAEMSISEVNRTDTTGNSVPYFLYEISTTISPRRAGPLTLQSPIIVMEYPVRLSRGAFGPRLAETRPIAVTATAPAVEVREPPAANQPASYSGAVGQFDIFVEAQPTDVAVGDPITLTITLIDRTDAVAVPERLDLLQPPHLDRVEELNQNFRIPGDALAGRVRNDTKVFTQTIRAKSAEVTRVPPIPFSFFDPKTEQYFTKSTNPIPIKVRATEQVALADIVQAPTAVSSSSPTELREIAGGLVANETNFDALLASQHFRLTWIHLAALAAPPLLFAGFSAARLASVLRKSNGSGRRRRNAKRSAMARLHDSRRLDPSPQAHAVIAALSEYVTDRLDLPRGSLTSDELVATLRRHGMADGDLTSVQNLLDECEQAIYAGGSADRHAADWIGSAMTCIKRLERRGI